MKMYKIIPIKPQGPETGIGIEVIEYDGTYDQMRPHLKYDMLGHARLTDKGDELFINDVGLLDGTREKDGSFWWQYKNGEWQEFVGEALLWGSHGEDNADPSMTIPELHARLKFTKPEGAQDAQPGAQFFTFNTTEELFAHLEANPPAWK